MFSNPIKRLSESLAQAQEQARQQRQKSQQRPTESKAIFDADNEEASFVNGDEPESKHSSEEPAKGSEEANTVSAPEPRDTTLPKEVRIKLAKLAKYEDRHPSKPRISPTLTFSKSCKLLTRRVRGRYLDSRRFYGSVLRLGALMKSMTLEITSTHSRCAPM
jgi:hypothetical protein